VEAPDPAPAAAPAPDTPPPEAASANSLSEECKSICEIVGVLDISLNASVLSKERSLMARVRELKLQIDHATEKQPMEVIPCLDLESTFRKDRGKYFAVGCSLCKRLCEISRIKMTANKERKVLKEVVLGEAESQLAALEAEKTDLNLPKLVSNELKHDEQKALWGFDRLEQKLAFNMKLQRLEDLVHEIHENLLIAPELEKRWGAKLSVLDMLIKGAESSAVEVSQIQDSVLSRFATSDELPTSWELPGCPRKPNEEILSYLLRTERHILRSENLSEENLNLLASIIRFMEDLRKSQQDVKLQQPRFPAPRVNHDEFYPDENSDSKVGQSIRDLLKKKTNRPQRSEGNTSAFMTVKRFEEEEEKKEDEKTRSAAPTPGAVAATEGVPWESIILKTRGRRMRGLLKLHNEILQFVQLIAETAKEHASREVDVEAMRKLSKEVFPNSQVEVFGSFANNLCIPSSDVDLVLLGAPSKAIFKLARQLEKRDMVQDMEVIATAKVPIIKLMLKDSKYQVDVSFGIEGGLETGRMIRKLTEEMPALRPLTLVVKYFLDQRDINETYKGGIGSHLCLCLVISLLQQYRKKINLMKSRSRDRVEDLENLGILLMEFLDLYGNKFNYADVGISLRHGGRYIRKPGKWINPNRPGMLCVENPEDPDADLGSSSFNIPRVRKAFAHAHRMLVTRISQYESGMLGQEDDNILSAIIQTDGNLKARARRFS